MSHMSPTMPRSRSSAAFPGSDHRVLELLREALALFDHDGKKARQNVHDAYILASADQPQKGSAKGGLSGWQKRQALNFIRSRLATRLKITETATQVNLSPSYFSRAFKVSFGIPYHDFVTRERISLAKDFLLTSDLAICEIALLCGVADQAHLTRLFSRDVGLPPKAWKRRFRLTADGLSTTAFRDADEPFAQLPDGVLPPRMSANQTAYR
jgi:AraC family transcriptional regulator